MDNGRKFILYQSLVQGERFELLLEINDSMRRWSVLNGIPLDLQARRIAVEQPVTPEFRPQRTAHIGAFLHSGEPVSVWDAGEWYPVSDAGGYDVGHLRFGLQGALLRGHWALVRMSGSGAVERPPWLLMLTSP